MSARSDALEQMPRWRSLDEAVKTYARDRADLPAFIEPSGSLTWSAYDGYITLLARVIVERGLEPGVRVGVWMPDGAAVHVALAACTRAGVVAVGIGARSGEQELRHLLGRSGATALLTVPQLAGNDTREMFDRLRADLPHLREYLDVDETVPQPVGVVSVVATPDVLAAAEEQISGLRIPADELSMLNSTSGTTGLPKCVAHDEQRWLKYHEYAVDSGALTSDDIFMSLVPAPFGFGLWTAHFTPTLLGAPMVILPRFNAADAARMLETERVSVLMAVSTQIIMLLADPGLADRDLSAMRTIFTGGETIPWSKTEQFEELTGAVTVNMYGSNETGVQSYTTIDDPRDKRLSTAGRVIPEVSVRLFATDGTELAVPGGPGRPASIGSVRSRGYYDDVQANAELYTDDGWMFMGDLVTIDDEGYLRVVGRTSDFIIRGGKNISAAAVEQQVSTMDGITRCAVVGVPDEVFGERVCLYAALGQGRTALTLDDVREHLTGLGISREWFPEYLVVLDELPTSSGGKIAKAALRDEARDRFGLTERV